MIRTIEINNFQSHSNTVLELSAGVNVIKGRSHSGKSSIVRALNWALLNNLSGDYFVSWFASKKETTSVGIEFDDNSYIIRKRDSKVNGYELPNTDLAAIRTDLPDEVKAITQMGTINIQDQDEQYFMLKETPGKVAKELNSLVGLDIIDQTLSRLNRLENENNSKLKFLEKDSKEIETGIKELDYVDDLEARVEKIEELWKKYGHILKQKTELVLLAKGIKEENEYIRDTKEWLTIKEPLERLKGLLTESAEIERSLNFLKYTIDAIDEAEIVRLRSDKNVKNLISKRNSILKSDLYKKEFCKTCGAHISHWRKK